ncbi:DUF7680 family protein [Sulfobacillus thermosulfidooxidans]|uniref:DUF7680 family protein n=1 Tax=Sulfobacillus thermosulfidooxidans TaxID=28034 RepID=UPI001FA77121|nr:hypothetical protein [Sulfobacillus thermosulfidooxidans]
MRKPYQLRILKDHDNAVRLELWQMPYNASSQTENTQKVGSLRGLPLTACHSGVTEVLRQEGQPPSVLSRPHGEMVELTEDAGIYLALLFRLIRPLKRLDRIQNVVQGLARMTPDERQYFFARIQYPRKGRYMERALRLWLGEE